MKNVIGCIGLFLIIINGYTQRIPGNAVDFSVKDVNGAEHKLFSYLENNKYVMLKFTATW